MDTLEESALKTLSGKSNEIFEYLPYLLQDLWALGSLPEPIIGIIRKNNLHKEFKPINILDLGCGKGGVSIPIVQELNAFVTGIDALEPFIKDANTKAFELNVKERCKFIRGDLRNRIEFDKLFDIVMLASVGSLMGNLKETLNSLGRYLIPGGYIILDESYTDNHVANNIDGCYTKNEFYGMIQQSNFIIIDEFIHPPETTKKRNIEIFSLIKSRAEELIIKYPDKKPVFDDYIESQNTENKLLENDIVTILLLLMRK